MGTSGDRGDHLSHHGAVCRLVILPNIDTFIDSTERFSTSLKNTPLADGVDRVLVPGEPEAEARRQQTLQGIPLFEPTLREIRNLAMGLNLAVCGLIAGQEE